MINLIFEPEMNFARKNKTGILTKRTIILLLLNEVLIIPKARFVTVITNWFRQRYTIEFFPILRSHLDFIFIENNSDKDNRMHDDNIALIQNSGTIEYLPVLMLTYPLTKISPTLSIDNGIIQAE